MNIRKLQLKDNISSIVLTEKSTLEQFILKYKLQMEPPSPNILMSNLTISDTYVDMCKKEKTCYCKSIINITDNIHRRCVLPNPCDKCPLYYKNESTIKLIMDELKMIEDPK